jgi:predicted secreted protein
MNWFTGIMVYVIVWWLVFFTTLPFGVRLPDNVEPGHDVGAPEKPRLWMKALISSVIAGVLFGIIYYVIDADLISFRRMSP